MDKEKAYDLYLTVMDSLYYYQTQHGNITQEEIDEDHREVNKRMKEYLDIQ
ncbi:hypothetical protein [Gracilibacillus saliphilus]|uniref:hypothetical protein n=1 Tax=Gracilibacillus saliphilus TaxID=543890 RepID=UPI0013D10564|nr:hypothetical protein [Gracilibacillus saliphilus]